jgi:hypothetical protein
MTLRKSEGKQRSTRFETDNSVVERIPKNIADAEGLLGDYSNSIAKTIGLVTALCCSTPNSISEKGANPLEYSENLFARYYKAYEEQVFGYCDILLMCDEYHSLDGQAKQAGYFENFKRAITIEGCEITGERERAELYKNCWDETEELRVRLLGLAASTPADITPQNKEPIGYVTTEVRTTFEKILDASMLMLKLVFLGQESVLFKDARCLEKDTQKRTEWFWENCVETIDI